MTCYPSVDKPWLKHYDENKVVSPLPRHSLYQNIYEENKKRLDYTALVYFGKKISYRKFFEMIHEAERKLLGLGVRKGDVITFISIATPEQLALFYAINKIGAVSSLLDPRISPESQIKNIIKTNTKVVFILDACADSAQKIVSEIDVKVVLLRTSTSMGQPIKLLYSLKNGSKKIDGFAYYEQLSLNNNSKEDSVAIDVADEVAAIFYTGGTTGESKGVVLTNYNINSVVEQFRKISGGFEAGQKWLTTSVPFVAYVMICSLHMPLSFGMECNIELFIPAELPNAILRRKINHIAGSPVLYEELMKKIDSKTDLSFLVMPVTGADKLDPTTYDKVNNMFEKHCCEWKICNGYGMTEVGSGACVSLNTASSNKAGSVGIPLPNTIVTTFDVASGQECKLGESGELCIAGPGVMKEYFDNPDETAKVIKEHDGQRWLHTGDIAHIDEDGCVFIEGRIKRMIIKFDGFKVFPDDVESKLMKCEMIENCCCVAANETNGCGQVPVLFYVPKPGCTDAEIEAELKRLSDETISSYARPVKYIPIEKLPRTGAQKVDYRKLEEMCE